MPAEAGNRLVFSVGQSSGTSRVDILPNGRVAWVARVFPGHTSTPFYTVTVEGKSDAGTETVTLVESDAWLHGSARITALPTAEASLTVTLYDTASASLMSFSGTLGTDGTVTLAQDAAKATTTGTDCASRSGCTDGTSDTTSTTPDIELLSAQLFAASGGYDVSLDFAGADTYEVAYAAITVTPACDSGSRTCATATTAEVGWDGVGSVWDGELTLDHEGVVELTAKTYDSAGKKIESQKAKLGMPWLDDGEGINALATDEDPLTTVGIGKRGYQGNGKACQAVNNCDRLLVNSEGWSSTSTLPTSAKVELTSGSTITMSSATLWRMRKRPELLYQSWDATLNDSIYELETSATDSPSDGTISITGGAFELYDVSVADLGLPVCSNGVCVSLVTDDAGQYDLSVSTYGTTTSALSASREFVVSVADADGVEVASDTLWVEFDDELSIVFANEVSFTEDPIGLDLSGKVSLLGAADKKGRQKTLAKGKFYGSFSRDGDGDLTLAGADKDAVTAKGSVVVAGSEVTFELTTDTNGDGVLNPPPLTPVFGNGSGTKNSASQTSGKPELL